MGEHGTMTMPTDKPRVLVVDDEPDVCQFIADVAESVGYRCTSTSDPKQFMATLGPDAALIIVDLVMPGIDGIELLRFLSERDCGAGIVLVSGFDERVLGTAEELAKTLGLRVRGRFQKPIRLADLESFLKQELAGTEKAARSAETGRSVTEFELHCALDRDQLRLHYQAQVAVASGRIVGMEALVRWQHPERGLIFPERFIGLAESAGLIDQLGWQVLRKGISDLRSFSAVNDKLSLSVNVSANSLHDLNIPEKVVALATEHGVQPSNIVLEITESGLARELSKALDILTRLRVKHVQLAIDDFGTGYSMMQQLRRVPATEIKVDKSFVQDAPHDHSARVVVEKTIELGHELGMRVVAEGVETIEQWSFLKQAGCDVAQGYLFSRPVPVGAAMAQLETGVLPVAAT